MLFFMDPEFWARLFGIVIIDLTLAGDNALVIALAVRTLPRRQQFWGRVWGTAGAVGLRLAFIAVATLLLRIPMLQLAGGLLLVWIAWKLVRKATGAPPASSPTGPPAGRPCRSCPPSRSSRSAGGPLFRTAERRCRAAPDSVS